MSIWIWLYLGIGLCFSLFLRYTISGFDGERTYKGLLGSILLLILLTICWPIELLIFLCLFLSELLDKKLPLVK